MKLSLKSFISLLKYVMVIVIVFVFAMVVICLFMPTSMENFKEGVDDELTIDTLTRDIIINMTLEDLYKNVFEPFSDFNVDDFLTKGKALKSKLIELSNNATDPLTEKDIITLITKQMIEVNPSPTQVMIIDVCKKVEPYYKNNKEIMKQKENEIAELFQLNIFPQQKINLGDLWGVLIILMIKHEPKFKGGVSIMNPFTKKTIDQFTGLPTPTPTTSASPTPTASATPKPTPKPTPTSTPATKEKRCSTYNNNEPECISNSYKGINCVYDIKTKFCKRMKPIIPAKI